MSQHIDEAWGYRIYELLKLGKMVSPRGINTLEQLGVVVEVNSLYPVLLNKHRKLSYQFMAAEAYWILSGDDTVAGIEPYNKHITQFSDNGQSFFGAYGPKITSQIDYVIRAIENDPVTRQAGLTIWRENPPKTKDIPCTVAMFFNLRDGFIHADVFMRSSDVWLGLPYDIFNFSMVIYYICAALSSKPTPGSLRIHIASSHLYEKDIDAASKCLSSLVNPKKPPPLGLYSNSTAVLMAYLKDLRDTKPGDYLRWWEL